MEIRPAGWSDSESDEDDDDYYSRPRYCRPPTNGGPKTFEEALRIGDINALARLVNLCLDKGGTLDTRTAAGNIPLMEASFYFNPDAVEILLKNGANPNICKDLTTPLMSCCSGITVTQEQERIECVKLLLEYKADPNRASANGCTALMLASRLGSVGIVRELVSHPTTNLNLTDPRGWTALFYAYNEGHSQIVDLLISSGSVETLKDRNGSLATFYAKPATEPPHQDIPVSYLFTDPVIPVDVQSSAGQEPLKSSLEHFFSQLPDDDGNGGFSEDAFSILYGAGVHFLKLPQLDLPTILRGSDEELKRLGIKLSPVRRMILASVHQYHLHPWSPTSLHTIPPQGPLWMEDAIHSVSGVLRHLTIINAAISYIKQRAESSTIHPNNKPQLLFLLTRLHNVQNKLRYRLNLLNYELEKIINIGEIPPGYVRPEEQRNTLGFRIFAAVATLVIATVAFLRRR